VSTLFARSAPPARCRPFVGGLSIGLTPRESLDAILAANRDFDIHYRPWGETDLFGGSLLIARGAGERLLAAFAWTGGEPRAVMIGRALLYPLGPTLTLEETTQFEIADDTRCRVRTEIRYARIRWLFEGEAAARRAWRNGPRFGRPAGVRDDPPVDARCAMSDHLSLVRTSGAPETVAAFVDRQENWSAAAMHHHRWLATTAVDLTARSRPAVFGDCVLE